MNHRLRIIIPAFPAFNIYSRVANQTTALGPVCIASVVNKMSGWDVEVIDENNYRKHGPLNSEGMPDHAALQELRPASVVGFYGGLSSTVPRIYDLVAQYKKMGVLAIAGGLHFIDENIEDGLRNGLDVIVMGEGEDTVRECLPVLVSGGSLKEIAGLAFLDNDSVCITPPRPPIEDFDKYPIPDFSLLRYAKINIFPVSWGRGCGMNCEFCAVKGKARYATAERLLEQFMSAAERWSATLFFIVDDLFGQDREQALRFCKMLKEYQGKINKKFFVTAQIRLDKAKDPELLQAMRDAGVGVVAIGFESPIPEELTAMNKHLKPEDMIEMTKVFHRLGFLIHGMFIFGYPLPPEIKFKMSAMERVYHFKQFIKKAHIDTIQVLLAIPLPGTELTRRLKEDKRIFSRDYLGWQYYDGNFPLYMPEDPLTPEETLMAVKKITGSFYRFKEIFAVGFHTISFPVLVFWLHNLKSGWNRWYRQWRNSVRRFGGWVLFRHWLSQFKNDNFIQKLSDAQKNKKDQ
ncbi:MAG: hypothetical protein A2020_14940 [Lentisphaerae bacterium GWF2_45_14]|nr:MAG: hypothetical protein A2020_14940 [Lentisphaerae bacterium GWF2_45_14]